MIINTIELLPKNFNKIFYQFSENFARKLQVAHSGVLAILQIVHGHFCGIAISTWLNSLILKCKCASNVSDDRSINPTADRV